MSFLHVEVALGEGGAKSGGQRLRVLQHGEGGSKHAKAESCFGVECPVFPLEFNFQLSASGQF